jgi:hypothetical protein
MATTIISNISSFDFEPDILTDNGRDGVTSFQFSIVGGFSALNSNFSLGQDISGVPDQPPGNFKVVRRNMSHIAGNVEDGLYRVQITGEGGTGDNSLFVLETSYQYQKEIVSGFIQLPTIDSAVTYICEWLSPTVTITTNSQTEDVTDVQNRAKALVASQQVQIIRNKPDRTAVIGTVQYPVFGPGIDESLINIVGSSVENAGGLFRVRASATRGQMQLVL